MSDVGKIKLVHDEIKLKAPKKLKNDRSFGWLSMLEPSGDDIGQHYIHSKPSSNLVLVMLMFVILLFMLIASRLFYMQVLAGGRYLELANGNRVRENISYAPRGRVLDRNGKVLAENSVTFQLSCIPYLLESDKNNQEEVFKMVGNIINVDPQALRETVFSKGEEHPLPVLVKENLDHQTAIALEQIIPRAKGFAVDSVPSRKYVADAGLAHILGYTGRVSEDDMKADNTNKLLATDFIGKAGIEKQYDTILRGGNGFERTEVDSLGRPVRFLAQKPALKGNDITLTIDYDVQVRLEREIVAQMQKSKTTKGAGVVLSPETGEILAMVSIPYYDNNLFAGGISESEYSSLVNDPRQPLLNKAIGEGYTTGSTIKPVVAVSALQEKVVTPETVIVDRGQIAVTSVYQPGASFIFRGWRPGGLGPMNVRSAIAMSSNIYFYTVGGGHENIQGLGVDRLTSYYRKFGLGELSGIDLPDEFIGRVPDSTWKEKNKGEPWYVGDTYNISIGQGDILVTPLQLTLADMSIANGGYLLQPYLLKNVDGQEVGKRTVKREVPIDKGNINIVREGMRQVVTNGTTCECIFKNVPVKVAGKSGTAETSTGDKSKPHAWFTAYAPYDKPEVMATVIIEQGSGGSQYSAPAISGAMETYFLKNPR